MTVREEIIRHAKMTMAAEKNPYGSVDQVFPAAIDRFLSEDSVGYLGVKNVSPIPGEAIEALVRGGYALHTLDKAAPGGRAVDMQLKNPITGHPMTGSSSGTAMNVLLHFNDLGIGTDGGGSVLAPAMSVNLYGFISPLICAGQMKKYGKRSTDGIWFYPSLGLMARTYKDLCKGIEALPGLEEVSAALESAGSEETGNLAGGRTMVSQYQIKDNGVFDQDSRKIKDDLDRFGERESLILFLKEYLPQCDFLVSEEGPVDVNGMGDTVFGHFDEETRDSQKRAGKGLIRVANMAGATAVCIPTQKLGCGQVLLCQSVPEKISRMLAAAKAYECEEDQLLSWYFGNLDQYIKAGAFLL